MEYAITSQTINNRAMIQLTEKVIAVEVPNDEYENARLDIDDLTGIHLKYKNGSKMLHVNPRKNTEVSLIGVTPLSEEQWKEVVDSKQIGQMTEPRWRDHKYGEFVLYGLKTATESGLSLLESKGLDINKKYAIIKIEK